MKTIAVIGARPGLGFSLAKTFGRNGFRIAMVSRTQEKLDQYAVELRDYAHRETVEDTFPKGIVKILK